MTQAVAALGQQNNRTAITASVRGHVESFVCLNEIKVIRRTATAGDNKFALLVDRDRMTAQVLATANLMRGTPVAGIKTDRPPSFINYAVDAEARLDQRGDSFAFLVEGISLKESCAYPGPASAIYKVKRQPVGSLNGVCGSESGTDGFAAASKTSEVMKANGTG